MGKTPATKGKRFSDFEPTAAEKRARAKLNQENFRTKLQAAKVKFDDKQKTVYLNHLAKTGRKAMSAKAAGVCLQTVLDHRENDPEFNEAVENALAMYADKVHQLAERLMEGVDEPIIGGKDKDAIVAFKKVHATNLVAMELRRTNPEYKERQEIDLKSAGGVLVAPADKSPEQWIEEQQKLNEARKKPGPEDAPAEAKG